MPVITEPKKLSMPQQVEKNKRDIEEILKKIDGLDATDNVIVVPDISHIMTADELKSVRQPVAFIVYDDKIFIKKKEENGSAYFDIVFSIVLSTVITLASEEIEVNLTNGALGIVNSSVSTYSVSQIDNKFASIIYVDSALAAKADLSGANFTGAITAPSIIESGLVSQYTKPADTANYSVNTIFASAVKTGNKITFVVFIAYTIISTVSAYQALEVGNFSIPNEIGNKLYPYSQGSLNNILAENISILQNSEGFSMISSGISNVYTQKISNQNLRIFAYSTQALEAGKTYLLRYEQTFLLSENLAQ